MTAVNIIVQRRRALVMTDAAVIDAADRLLSIEPKGVELPHMRGFMMTTGDVQVGKAVMDVLESFDGIDDFAENGMACAEKRSRCMVERWPRVFDDTPFSVHVIGWSAAKDAPRYVSFHWNRDGFNFWADDPTWFSPGVSDADFSSFRLSVRDNGGIEKFNPCQEGLTLMQVQRRKRLEERVSGCFFVGGYMQLVTITEACVTREILWLWPDTVGELIQPLGRCDGAPVGTVTSLLPVEMPRRSRHGRRAMAARRQRRAA